MTKLIADGPSTGGPRAARGAASNVTQDSATLNATVNPQGSPTNYRFEYGTQLR